MKLASKDKCTACSACVNICNHDALVLNVDGNGYFEVMTDKSKCVECGICSKVCPILNPIQTSEPSAKYFACVNNNNVRRKQSASGGAFSAIAEVVLRRGGIVYGASIDGFEIVHRRIERLEDLHEILGSKYQPGNLTGIFINVRDDLNKGMDVLFSGMPCQVAGLKKFLLNTPTDNLYTIDTICGGFSTMTPMIKLKQSGKYKSIHSFRNKDNGWSSTHFLYDLKMVRIDGTIEDLHDDNLVLKSFSSKLLKRASCCNCNFTSPYRYSDVTIGDFWGDNKYKNLHYEGLSVIAIHNERLTIILNESSMSLFPITIEEMTKQNYNYYFTQYPLIKSFISRKIALWALSNNKVALSNYLLSFNSVVGLIIRLYLKLLSKLYKRQKIEELKRIQNTSVL